MWPSLIPNFCGNGVPEAGEMIGKAPSELLPRRVVDVWWCGSVTARRNTSHVTSNGAGKIQMAAALNTAVSDMAAGQRGLILFTYAKDAARAAEAKDLSRRGQDHLQKAVAGLRPLMLSEANTQSAAAASNSATTHAD